MLGNESGGGILAYMPDEALIPSIHCACLQWLEVSVEKIILAHIHNNIMSNLKDVLSRYNAMWEKGTRSFIREQIKWLRFRCKFGTVRKRAVCGFERMS